MSHRLVSTRLGEARDVRVAVPSGYGSSTVSYPVLYVLDGSYNLEHTADSVKHLSDRGTIPQMIVVAVHNVSRELDMTPPDLEMPTLGGQRGRADVFLDFFEEELIPFVDETYRTQPLRLLVGHSHGGIFSDYALVARPALFRWHLALDAPVHHQDRWLARRVTEAVAQDPGLHKRFVTVEEAYGWEDDEWKAMASGATPGFHLARIDGLDETHESMAFLGTILGLKELFFDFARPDGHANTLDELSSHYEQYASGYGYRPSIPLGQLIRHGQNLVAGGQGQQGMEVLARAKEMYGDSPTIRRLSGEAKDAIARGDGGASAQVRQLLDSPPLRAADAARFLGVWEGTSFHEGGVPVDLIVTLAADGDIVAGSTDSRIGDRPYGTQEHAFLRMVEDEGGTKIEWGEMNQRGPGVGVYSMTLQEDGTLVGRINLVGIPAGIFPADFVMPTIDVNLRRRR